MQSILDQGVCPVSSKRIEVQPEWKFDFGDYKVQFGLLEPGIVLTYVWGTPTVEYLSIFYEVLEAAILEKGWDEFHTISDYTDLETISSAVRDFNSQRIKAFDKLSSLNIIGASTSLKVNLHIGRILNRHTIHINLCANYSEAFRKARSHLKIPIQLNGTHEQWVVAGSKGEAVIELLGENILLTRAEGYVDLELVERYLNKLEDVLQWLQKINGSSVHHRILDAGNVKHISVGVRKVLARGLSDLGIKYHVVNGYLVGKSFIIRLAFQMARAIFQHKVYSVNTTLEALQHIRSTSAKEPFLPEAVHGDDHFWVNSLLNDLAGVDWSVPGKAFEKDEKILPPEWMPLYDAIEIIKTDIDTLMCERENRNKELELEKERSNILARELQKALEVSEDLRKKAENSMKVKEEFLANMSHEIRTPLNAVIGMTELVAETELNPDQKDMVDTVKTAGKNLLALLNDILDLSKLEAGKVELESVAFDIVGLIRELTQLMRAKADEKEIALLTSVDKLKGKWFLGDRNRIRQVLLNFVSNAIKFTDEGHVKIYAETLERTGEIVIGVQDTGVGIESSRLNNLFESFSQEDNSITRKYGGTGLGLSISKMLVDLMGTKIEVESEKGKGANFYFKISLSETEPVHEAEEKVEFLNHGEVKVLLVEDNLVNQKVFTRLLNKIGINIDVANNGQEGVDKALANDFDLILMDLQMPVMDGLTATHEIRSRETKKNIIVALTANALSAHREQAKQVGMDDFLTKPLIRNELIKCFNHWLASKQV